MHIVIVIVVITIGAFARLTPRQEGQDFQEEDQQEDQVHHQGEQQKQEDDQHHEEDQELEQETKCPPRSERMAPPVLERQDDEEAWGRLGLPRRLNTNHGWATLALATGYNRPLEAPLVTLYIVY